MEQSEHLLLNLIANGDDTLRRHLYESVQQENVQCRKKISLIDNRVQGEEIL